MRTKDLAVLGAASVTVVLLGIVALLVSGSGADDTVVAGSTTTNATVTGAPATTGSTVATSVPPTTATSTTIATSSQAPPPAETAGDVERQLLGELPQGGGYLVRLVAVDDTECSTGELVVEVDGVVTHNYGGGYGHLTLHPGPFGQAAMVEQCEESIGSLFFTSTIALSPGDGPDWSEVEVPPSVFYLAELGWQGLTGFFGADATFYDGTTSWTDTVVFDAFDGSMAVWADKLGSRDEHPLIGVDVVVPNQWNHAPIEDDSPMISMWDLESPSFVEILVTTEAPTVPAPFDGEHLVTTSVSDVDLWTDVGSGRARRDGTAQAVDYRFSNADGARAVRIISLDDRTVTIESFLAAAAGQASGEVPAMAVEAVRIFTSVG